MARKMHLNAFMMYTPMVHAVGSWALPGNRMVEEFTTPKFWQEIARILEAGCFDMVFLGDHLAPYDVYKDDPSISIRYGLQFPVHDPVSLIPWMASATEHLGFGVTMSTAFYQPYLLTRKMSTLDHLTSGRMAWNVVTSAQENEARNMGLGEMLPHDERYDRADEYMDVCYALWDSWAPDAMIARAEDSTLSDPSKVRTVHHDGKYFTLHAPANVCASPQRKPVIMQAGGSPRGRDFAAKHAEVIFAIKRTPEDMAEFVSDMERRAAQYGRSRDDFKVVFGAQVVQGATSKEAEDLQTSLVQHAELEPSLAKFSGIIGVDLAEVDVDAPIKDLKVPGAQGLLDIFTQTRGETLSLREAVTEYGASGGNPQIVGTPDEVAETMRYLLEEGGGDGFNLTPPILPQSYENLVREVVPRLQKMGVFRSEYSSGSLRDRMFE